MKGLCALVFLFVGASFVSCAATAPPPAPSRDAVEVYYVFDGSSLQKVTPVQGRITVEEGITEGNYGVVFSTKEGYAPLVEVFKAAERPYETKTKEFTELTDTRKGMLTGVVYKAVSGGKLRPRRGIVTLYPDLPLRIVGKDRVYTEPTDAKGVYRLLLPAGEYTVAFETGGPVATVVVEPGKTVIHPIRRGAMLVD